MLPCELDSKNNAIAETRKAEQTVASTSHHHVRDEAVFGHEKTMAFAERVSPLERCVVQSVEKSFSKRTAEEPENHPTANAVDLISTSTGFPRRAHSKGELGRVGKRDGSLREWLKKVISWPRSASK